MHRVLMAALILALPGAARAGDFTGAYVGLNAGRAFGGERDRRADGSPVIAPGPSAGDGVAAGLPPSAAMAAGTLKRSPSTLGGSAKR